MEANGTRGGGEPGGAGWPGLAAGGAMPDPDPCPRRERFGIPFLLLLVGYRRERIFPGGFVAFTRSPPLAAFRGEGAGGFPRLTRMLRQAETLGLLSGRGQRLCLPSHCGETGDQDPRLTLTPHGQRNLVRLRHRQAQLLQGAPPLMTGEWLATSREGGAALLAWAVGEGRDPQEVLFLVRTHLLADQLFGDEGWAEAFEGGEVFNRIFGPLPGAV